MWYIMEKSKATEFYSLTFESNNPSPYNEIKKKFLFDFVRIVH